jgi:hypothetical protein
MCCCHPLPVNRWNPTLLNWVDDCSCSVTAQRSFDVRIGFHRIAVKVWTNCRRLSPSDAEKRRMVFRHTHHPLRTSRRREFLSISAMQSFRQEIVLPVLRWPWPLQTLLRLNSVNQNFPDPENLELGSPEDPSTCWSADNWIVIPRELSRHFWPVCSVITLRVIPADTDWWVWVVRVPAVLSRSHYWVWIRITSVSSVISFWIGVVLVVGPFSDAEVHWYQE